MTATKVSKGDFWNCSVLVQTVEKDDNYLRKSNQSNIFRQHGKNVDVAGMLPSLATMLADKTEFDCDVGQKFSLIIQNL